MMKNQLRKLISFALTAFMIIGMSVPAFATETENPEAKPAIEDTSIYTGQTFFYNAETGEMIAENGDPFAFEEIKFQVPETDLSEGGSDIAPAAVSFELYLIRGGLKKTSYGTFTWWFNVDCPTSPFNKPNITLTAQLQGNFTTGSSFSNVGGSVYHTYKTNSEYGVDYTWTSTAKTGYYRFKYILTDHDAGGAAQTKTTGSNLWNRTGHVWNFSFSDSASGKSLPKPPANYKKGATSSRPANLADTYYKTYKQNTGVTLNRSLYDVHHIRPLAYGGSNNYSNLIHLPKGTHKSVTSWWNGY